jgi:hypothetical protein
LPPSAVHGSKKGSRSYLQFNTGMFIIRYENSKDYQNEPYEGDVKNQYKLFDFLYELKIDYRGLIESGLAIDCNTLENNPYK